METINIEIYKKYYKTIYPYQPLYKWLMYDGQLSAQNREWSYEGYSFAQAQTFVKRFVEVTSDQHLYTLVNKEANYLIQKLDIGPYYNQAMNTKQTSTFAAKWREFVFDIDADDYKQVRKCCTGAQMCSKCWRFMECACAMISYFCLMFGFENFMFCFSGRRGLHGWIVDQKARNMQVNARETIIQTLNLVESDTENAIHIKYNSKALNHYHLFQIAEAFFSEIKDEQGWFSQQNIVETRHKIDLINKCLDKSLGASNAEFEKINKLHGDEMLGYIQNIKPELYQRIVLYFVAPRLDINVTKQMNHLLKIPFSIHPKSMYVSVPVCAHAIINDYGLTNLIKFPLTVQPIGYRFKIEDPIKPMDEARLTQVIEWFEAWTDKVVENTKNSKIKNEYNH